MDSTNGQNTPHKRRKVDPEFWLARAHDVVGRLLSGQTSFNIAYELTDREMDRILRMRTNDLSDETMYGPDYLISQPVHDPPQDNAIILHTLVEEGEKYIVIDPLLGTKLWPHQIEGVQFMWKCLKGQKIVKDAGDKTMFRGCILADGMGIGKTVQVITLIWTLLRQGRTSKPEISNALIIAPKSVVSEWKEEFNKWLEQRITICVIEEGSHDKGPDGTAEGRTDRDRKLFLKGIRPQKESLVHVLVTSYDYFRINKDDFYSADIDLLVCDEAHGRLSNDSNKAYEALNKLRTSRRILITGTPLTNDLDNLYHLVNFVNPGIFGLRSNFDQHYGSYLSSIVDAAASPETRMGAKLQLRKLHAKLRKFMIRRTHVEDFPCKHEFLVFCGMSKLQKDLYETFIQKMEAIMEERRAQRRNPSSRPGINVGHLWALRNICNHPDIIYEQIKCPKSRVVDLKFLELCFEGQNLDDESRYNEAGKMKVLATLLGEIKEHTKDHVIIASYSTEALDRIEKLCRHKEYSVGRYIGKTSVPERNQIIKDFNNGNYFILLISVQAGGCGLNLAQANRLVMYDADWTSAADRQAIARIWRLNQQKTPYVYRLLTTGTIDERIFQRQAQKGELGVRVVDRFNNFDAQLSTEDVRDLIFRPLNTKSDTHDKIRCECQGKVITDLKKLRERTLMEHGHYFKPAELPHESYLEAVWNHGITCAFYNISKLMVDDQLIEGVEPDDQEEPKEDENTALVTPPSPTPSDDI